MRIRWFRFSALVVIALGVLFLFATRTAFADSCTSNGSGNWSSNAWSCGHTPTGSDDVFIANGDDVTLDVASATINSLTINDGNALSRLGISGTNSLTINGNVTIASTTANVTKSLAVNSGTASIGGNVTLTGGATSSTGLAELSIGTTGSATVSGNINVNNTQAGVNFVAGSGTLKIGGDFQSGGTLTNNTDTTIEYDGAGAQSVGAYTYHNLTISGGNTKTLAGHANAAGTLTVKAGATFALASFNFGATSAPSVVMEIGSTGASISGTSGTLTLGGDVTVNAPSGNSGATISAKVALGATRTFTIADDGTSATDLTISNIISGSGAGITKMGAGTMVLSGSNTYTGVTTINSGVLSVGAINNGGAVGSLGQATNAAGNLVLGGGTLRYTGGTASTDRAFTLTAATTSAIEVTTFNLTISGASATTTGALTKIGNGTLTLSGANTFSGGMTLDAGTLNINHDTAIGSGAFTINGGTISTNSSRTLTNNNAQNWNGDFTYNSTQTLNMGTGAVSLNGNRQVTVSSGTLTVGGVISGSSFSLTKAGNGTCVLTGANTHTGGTTLSAGILDVQENSGLGSGAITITSGTLQSSSGARTFTNAVVVNGNFSVGSTNSIHLSGGIDLSGGTRVVTVSNSSMDFFMDGIITNGRLEKSGVGRLALTNPNSTFSGGLRVGAGSVTFDANSTPTSGTPTSGPAGTGTLLIVGGTVGASGSTRTLANPVLIQGDFTIGRTGATNSLVLNGNVDLVTSNRTITIDATTSPATLGGAIGRGSLTKEGTGTLSLGTNSVELGSLTINAGTLTSTSGQMTLTGANGFSNSATFIHNSGTVRFFDSPPNLTKTLTANTATIFNNLTVSSGIVLVEDVAADNATVSGTLTNNGTIRKSQAVSGIGVKTFGLAGAFNGANLSIDVTTQGTLSNLQVDRVDSNHPNSNGTAQQTGRYWNITPTDSGYTANLTLPRNNAGSSSVCKHISGSTWSCAANSNTSNDVTRNGITSFSAWAVGNNAPTSATLTSFTAKLTRQKTVRVKWETGSELNIVGFNVYRATKRGGVYKQLNAAQLNANNVGSVQGATYAFTDDQLKSGKTYFYKIEIVKPNGTSEWSDVKKVKVE